MSSENAGISEHSMPSLNQYRGFLTSEQIAAGINASRENAKRIAEDAEILLNAGRFPSASSLAILSLEELGKSTWLRQMAAANTQAQILKLWKSYRRHIDKHLYTLAPRRVASGARKLIDMMDCVTDTSLDERMTFDNLKQLGFYTDCLGKAHWSIPVDIVDEKLAGSLVAMAKRLSSIEKTVTTREIELWTTHMNSGVNRSNLLAWARAVEAEGLQPVGYAEEMADFTLGLQ